MHSNLLFYTGYVVIVDLGPLSSEHSKRMRQNLSIDEVLLWCLLNLTDDDLVTNSFSTEWVITLQCLDKKNYSIYLYTSVRLDFV